MEDILTVKQRAEKLYKKVHTFILTCVGTDGYPLSKAVVPGKYRDTINEMYFCTNTSSKFVSVINNNPKANVYFYSRNLIWKGCMLKGKMEIVSDKTVKEKYWQNKFKNAYKEKSYTDPDFCVLKFVPEAGRFYSWYKPEDFEI
jgi:general stress protein 26